MAKPFSVGQIFDGWDKAQVAIAALIIAAATFVGTLLCDLPGLIVGFLTGYTLLFIVDKQMTAVDAIKASVSFVWSNLGNTLLFWILGLLALAVGAIICFVGLLVAAPVVLIGLAYTYRRLQNEPSSPISVVERSRDSDAPRRTAWGIRRAASVTSMGDRNRPAP